MNLTSGMRAAFYMIVATLFLSLVPVCVKAIPAEAGVSVSQKLFARASISAIITLFILLIRRIQLKPGSIRLVGARSIFGITGMFAYFTAVESMPLAEAVTINRLSPFFVLIFAWWFLKEKLRKAQIVALLLGLGGVVVILRPGVIPITLPAGFALLSAVFAGSAYTAIRALRKTDRSLIIVFWFSLLMSLVFLPAVVRNGVIPDSGSLTLLLCIGIFGAAGQLFMTAAYRYAPGGKVAIYSYLSVVFSMLWQIMFFSSIPSIAVFAGAALILLGGWINYRVR
ncbi:MAG: DMT family transporter [Candidatus Aegiribacteria sp.]|nr:DMT family transporter [Candidatus Aegiribacteria sp.]